MTRALVALAVMIGLLIEAPNRAEKTINNDEVVWSYAAILPNAIHSIVEFAPQKSVWMTDIRLLARISRREHFTGKSLTNAAYWALYNEKASGSCILGFLFC